MSGLIASFDKEPRALLGACISPASFWTPEQLRSHSAWFEHAPFAFWLMGALRPRTFVELGTHSGFSYFSFCQAVQRLQLDTRCYAVDTWKGDEHAGLYGEEVFREVCRHNEQHYSAFSTLIRSTFDEALDYFVDGTLDLLHIDGRHFYEDVKYDFEAWRAKLSDRAVVLFHDINVRERGFGVFRLWNELCQSHPYFEFSHGHGLGVLGFGGALPDQIAELLSASADAAATAQIQRAYSRLGAAVTFQFKSQQLELAERRVSDLSSAIAQQTADLTQRANEIEALQQALSERNEKVAALDMMLAERADEVGALRQAASERDAEAAVRDQRLSKRNGELAALRATLYQSRTQISSLRSTVSALYASRSWRFTSPLRFAKRWSLTALAYPRRLVCQTLNIRWLAPLRDWFAVRTIRRSGLFASRWYLRSYSDVAALGIDPVRHYVTRGARKGCDPSPSFSTLGYLAHNPDVAAAGINPLIHFIRNSTKDGCAFAGRFAIEPATQYGPSSAAAALRADGARQLSLETEQPRDPTERYSSGNTLEADCALLADSGLFDDEAYRAAAAIGADIDAVEHYLAEGWRAGLEPCPGFEGDLLHPYYRSVGYSGPPAITYLKLRAAGVPVFARLADAEQWAAPIRTSDMFDAVKYAARLDDCDGLDPALHYVIVGEHMGFPPSDVFDPKYYRERYPDVAASPVNALRHYVMIGRQDGRRPTSIAHDLVLDRSRLDDRRETILLISHESSRTGAPILAWNIATRLRSKYNVVAMLLAGGELVEDFDSCCAAVIGPLTQAYSHSVEMKHLVDRILAAYPCSYAIVNSIASWTTVPALARALVPVVLLVHEFASYTRPKSAMHLGLERATKIVFSADVTARAAEDEHPSLMHRPIHILPQGRCDLPPAKRTSTPSREPEDLRQVFRPSGMEDALVVLGCGSVHIRKGIDLFLACAAAVMPMRPQRPVRFVWIGHGYDPENDASYSCYLADQIVRSGLEGTVAIIDEVPELEPVYAMTDVFFLSSRLDPLPNVTIDAALRGLPVVCFEGSSGMADILGADPSTRQCVVPHLDVHAAACVIAGFANDEPTRRRVGDSVQKIGRATFDMDRYVRRLDELGNEAFGIVHQRARDLATVSDDSLFDANMYLPINVPPLARTEAIIDFLARWAVVGTSPGSGSDYFFRRPCAGFHPQIYAHENAGAYDTMAVNPLAHFIRSGKPDGPWFHDVIAPSPPNRPPESRDIPLTALHGHFYYPELAENLLRKVAANGLRCDLLWSTDDDAKAKLLRKAASRYRCGDVQVRVVPNRGRDIGAFLSAFGDDIIARYDIVGHVHAKRSVFARGTSDPELGERWREFLWQNLIGDLHPMMDVIVGRFAADGKLGLVFADDPHLPDWDGNREIAEGLAARMGMTEPLPPFFDFPLGTMFWARSAALKPLFDLKLAWGDYPEEPVPTDATVVHAIERLLPFVARHAGFRFAATHLPGLTW